VTFRIAVLLLCGVAVAGCAGPMGQREAEARANRSLTSFCRQAACGTARLVKTEQIKDRWLIDFETQGGLYTVTVDRSGAAKVSVWDKNAPR
jgi:hypothetical protein